MELPEAYPLGASGAMEFDRDRNQPECKVSLPDGGRHGGVDTRICGAKHVYWRVLTCPARTFSTTRTS